MATKIGYHISISGGLKKTAKAITEQKLSAVQIFPGSPRSYFPGTKYTEEDFSAMKNINIPKFVHINYFVNLAGDNPVTPKSVAENMIFADKIGANGLVIHMGSNKNIEEGMKFSVEHLGETFRKYEKLTGNKPSVKILIETTAEGGNRLKLDKILELKELLPEINFVFDSAHLYAAGYSAHDIVELIEEHYDKIDLMHLNNPSPNVEFGKHKDQHDISLFSEDGKFSKREIENIMTMCSLKNIPMILETGSMESDLEFIYENYQNL